MVEIDPDANAVLRARFPDVELKSDINDLESLPSSTTILAAGFPCQNLSMAGDKTGIAGKKSGVVAKMIELIVVAKVPTVVIENVNFMLQLDAGRGMQWLVDRFEENGYKWAYRVLDTMGFGLPQRRRRVYFVACTDTDPRQVLFADETASPIPQKIDLDKPVGFYWTEGRSGVGLTADGIPPLKVGSSIGIASAPAVLFPDGEVLMPSLSACERLQGFEPGWTTVEGRTTEARKAQWRMIGNAVSVPVASWVANRIKAPGLVLDFEESALKAGARWPNAAWNIGGGRRSVKATDKPLGIGNPSIAEFRDESWTRLSDRALDGFISRAESGGLRMPDGFLHALRSAKRREPTVRQKPMISMAV
jgi:DNA (cytosine-5)-methyltransferase 1